MAYDLEKEKKEAIAAGNQALHSLRTAQENLNSARNWGIWDMFGGGFLLVVVVVSLNLGFLARTSSYLSVS